MGRIFNLNDPRWGRSDDGGDKDGKSDAPQQPTGDRSNKPQQEGQRNKPGASPGPVDLDEMFRDLSRKLGGLLGGGKNGGRNGSGSSGGGYQPDMKNAGYGVGLIAVVAFVIWMGTGVFTVQEGQQAVITHFGSYKTTVGAGLQWRWPYPIERHETVLVTQIRAVDVGRDNVIKATGLRESAMLTADENIVEIKFAVQYRLNDARAYLFESKDPANAVVQAAETAVREVVGNMRMSAALAEERDQIAPRVRTLMQTMLDRYGVGIEVVGINLQQTGVRPPEQVQAAFDDVLKAGQERERARNEAEAYANDVIPRAAGAAARLREESEAYRARIVAQAEGDSQRFSSVLAEYQKAPQVTRERMYVDAMQNIFTNVTKVLVDSKQGANLLQLPLDKIMQLTGSAAVAGADSTAAATTTAPAAAAQPAAAATDSRSRDAARTRERDIR